MHLDANRVDKCERTIDHKMKRPFACSRIVKQDVSRIADLERMHRVGASVFLVGESLMRQADVADATRTLLGRHAPAAAAE